MSDEKKKPDYTVGYGKPPKRTQFKAGRSGNPNGRPKKRTTLADDLETVLNSKVTLTENGKVRKVTIRRAIATRQAHKAMDGSFRFTKLLIQCLQDMRPDSHNNFGELMEEFRSIDRRLEEDRTNKDDDSSGAPENQPDLKGDKS